MPTIAILGASSNRSKFGNKCVRCYLDVGWEVFPVNPGATEVEGLKSYARLADIPGDLDRISVYLPPPVSLAMLPDMAERGAGDVIFNPGAADAEVLREAKRLGVPAKDDCAIVAVGRSPSMYPG